MKKIKVKYDLLLFLYAYLRQVDLSLDRSRWGSWNEFQIYFRNKIEPNLIIRYLKKSFNLSEIDFEQFVFHPKQKNLINKLKGFVLKETFLTEDEIFYCCKLLWKFDRELKTNTKKYNIEIEKIRIDIVKFYTRVLKLKITNKDLEILMKIEHFEQSDKIEVIELDQYIPNDFYLL